jgi:guanylate kinase
MADAGDKKRNVVVIAGPAGSGKDTLAKALLQRYSCFTLMVTATTRARRPHEMDGVNYHFFSKEKFLHELKVGNILEYYHREETDTYYGTYKPDIDDRIKSGKIVVAVIQIVGAKYLKEHYDATTLFIMPPSVEVLERRIRSRAPMSDVEWNERLEFTNREIKEESPWYDYRIKNDDDKLDECVASVVEILEKEGYTLE